MRAPIDRRQFLRITGTSLGLGALYQVAPGWASHASAADTARRLARKNGEAVTPFSFMQLSDTHVGFAGPPNPTGTRAFERAVEVVNALPRQPELIFFTGDLTHDSEGHIHREHVHDSPGCHHAAARSLIFAFSDPDRDQEKKPLPFDAEHPFRRAPSRSRTRRAPSSPRRRRG